jgi:hypothetical protein
MDALDKRRVGIFDRIDAGEIRSPLSTFRKYLRNLD